MCIDDFSLTEKEFIILKIIIQEIDNKIFRSYILGLIKNSFVLKREYSEYGMYIDFEIINTNYNINPPKNIPILFSIDLNTDDINSYMCCLLYLSEDRERLNFLEISTIYGEFYKIWEDFKI